jgi:ribosome-interacting GTPase 1
LQEEGTIEPVQFADWAAPIVPIVKDDKSIRICGDYKVTVNQVAKLDNYPIPKAEDLFTTLSGGEKFTKLDMSQAYQQILLEDESKKYTTINTHKGLFQYNRLPYGVSSSPGIFQRTMENLLQGISFVVVRVDDILVSGSNDEEHLANLEEVLKRLSEHGIRRRSAPSW